MKKDDCIFCKIADGKSPCYKIFENDFAIAFLDISKDIYGHTLVIPKEHFENIFDVDEKYLFEVLNVVKKVANHYKSLGFNGVNILNASGKPAEQTVMHLHFHIFPRKEGDEQRVYPNFAGTDVDFEAQLEKLKIVE